jgi:hypothetical protein
MYYYIQDWQLFAIFAAAFVVFGAMGYVWGRQDGRKKNTIPRTRRGPWKLRGSPVLTSDSDPSTLGAVFEYNVDDVLNSMSKKDQEEAAGIWADAQMQRGDAKEKLDALYDQAVE